MLGFVVVVQKKGKEKEKKRKEKDRKPNFWA
jgi:hypothetical protein